MTTSFYVSAIFFYMFFQSPFGGGQSDDQEPFLDNEVRGCCVDYFKIYPLYLCYGSELSNKQHLIVLSKNLKINAKKENYVQTIDGFRILICRNNSDPYPQLWWAAKKIHANFYLECGQLQLAGQDGERRSGGGSLVQVATTR